MDSEKKENILLLLTKNKKQYYMLNFDFFSQHYHFISVNRRMYIQSGYSKNLLKVGACQLLQDRQLDIQKQLPDLEASQRVAENLAFLSLL